ncbi:MAG: hypothetical protein EOP48_20235 [Sphingobacteriales bacterium]|nr:MAG: hypothetical protein EOP48_20235 [Sphingobacteriales bacterium]
MKKVSGDWRLQGQEKYLFGKKLFFKRYSDRKTTTDHDHCEFCFVKFSDTVSGTLSEGFTTEDEYRWICKTCFNDFLEKFKWEVSDTAR